MGLKNKGHLVQIHDPKDDVAIRVESVSKSFKLPHNKQSSLKGALVNLVGHGDRTYETQEVLKDVSFEVKKGDFFGIVGRNGSGKSTLLKMLAGIYTPTKGTIIVNGSLTPFIELGVGFNQELTGRDNIYLNGALLGFSEKEVDDMYQDIVDFAELEKFMDQKLKNYSSGMQVRLAFSIAIRARSDVLILDEVLAVGDAAFQAKCFDYFYELKRSDTTVVFISHDRGSLERFCERGILIDDGRVVESGKMSEVLDAYTDVVLGQMSSNTEKGKGSLPKIKAVKLSSIELTRDGKPIENANFGDSLRVEVELDVMSPVKSPIVGMTLWKAGVEDGAVYAANNLTEGIGELGELKKGTKITYTISLPSFINDGEYIVEVGVANESATNFYLQNRSALRFRVFGSHNPHAILANDAQMKLKIS